MVRALLYRRKTQTRRLIKPQGSRIWPHVFPNGESGWMTDVKHAHGSQTALSCHYGVPGERLWVREAWRVGKSLDGKPGSKIAPGQRGRIEYVATPDIAPWANRGRYRHARFMPRWASRITLEVTEVRAQRLQEISARDAVAEGVEALFAPGIVNPVPLYASLWDEINGKRAPWASNPWVWAITFMVL